MTNYDTSLLCSLLTGTDYGQFHYRRSNQTTHWITPSSSMLPWVALVKTEVSEELIASIIRMKRIGELGKFAVISNRSNLRRNAMYIACKQHFFSACVKIAEDGILHSHRRENHQSYKLYILRNRSGHVIYLFNKTELIFYFILNCSRDTTFLRIT
jgi:hypothetical protein